MKALCIVLALLALALAPYAARASRSFLSFVGAVQYAQEAGGGIIEAGQYCPKGETLYILELNNGMHSPLCCNEEGDCAEASADFGSHGCMAGDPLSYSDSVSGINY